MEKLLFMSDIKQLLYFKGNWLIKHMVLLNNPYKPRIAAVILCESRFYVNEDAAIMKIKKNMILIMQKSIVW